MIRLLTFLRVLALLWALQEVSGSCNIKLPDDFQGTSPVLLTRPSATNEYEFFKPTGQTTTMAEDTQLLLACTGSRNEIEELGTATLELQCVDGNFVDSSGNARTLHDIVCKSIPSSTLQLTSQPCGMNKGYIFEAGFTVDDQFYGPTFEICYDNVTEVTLYTHNTLNGAAMDYNIPESTRRSFSAVGMRLTTTKTNNFYTQKNQEQRFKAIFGNNQKYIKGSNYFARGHLTPDADFIFAYEQLSTYYYANAAPEYQLINQGNWLRVEELGRATAASYGRDIVVYNGYMGILKLPKDNGKLVEIYLDDDKQLVAPNYFFKVLWDQTADAAIVFVTVNNPFVTDGEAEEICENVCDASGLKHPNFPDISKGYTFCCRLEDFQLYYNDLPSELRASKLLTKKI